MILGPYRNPPYRTPTPKSSLSPPPPHGSTRSPSPKRKLHPDEADVPVTGCAAGSAQSLRVDTTWNSDGSLVVPDSPRSKVAERLKDLAIRQARPANAVTSPQRQSPSQSPRKKLKRNPHIRDLRGAVQARQLLGEAVQTPPHGAGRRVEIPDGESGNTPLVLEVDETILDDEDYPLLPPTPLREDGIRDLHQAIDMVMSSEDDAELDHYQRQRAEYQTSSRNNKRMLSPPPPSPLGQSLQGTNEETNLFLSRSPDSSFSDDATSFDPASLTWQDSEITGHEITSPDDDGEGINGIGFRPTPAIAYARSQKRRQQVEGWKAREAKEARQKRLERRRGSGRGKAIAGGGIGLDGANDGLASDGGTTRRTVRFAT
ncbi:hypothetical protein CKM354_000170900 [Cercospora kikuchii]|uniref:Uncharacterized protein n=1 Tax=Cercospora kikuchii TaxID=84275 RepID=A0A9P3C692_9PEZI|nr:uncharacterized protein CKM354_000170900 [Cercospora kikuchii]GIZ38289.1 hypothetical protein CKM354_000170900 [Cercospora kikuchii]